MTTDMTRGRIIPQITQFTIPLVLGNLFQQLYAMADTVIVLTRRPARVKSIIDIDLGLAERTPLSSRNAPLFKTYFNQIWEELNSHA